MATEPKAKKKHQGKKTHKWRQQAHNEKTGKYRRQFERTRKNKVRRIEKELLVPTHPESHLAYLRERRSHWLLAQYQK